MTSFVKQLLCLVLVLSLFAVPAPAQTALIDGEISIEPGLIDLLGGHAAIEALNGDLTAYLTDSGLYAEWENGLELVANLLSDGSSLVALGSMLQSGEAFHLPALPAENPLDRVHAWFDAQLAGEKSYINAVYSSLFTRALPIDLTGKMLAPVLEEVLTQYPFLPALLELDSADALIASAAQTDSVWGTITRYKGDEQQYPDLSLIALTLHIPSLPSIYLWLRTDEFGSTVKFAVENAPVTDWDETLLTLEEGKSDTGFLISGFTLNFEDDEELNIYLEGTLTTAAFAVTAECDYYLDYTGEYLWEIELEAYEDTLGELIEIELEAEESNVVVQIPALQ